MLAFAELAAALGKPTDDVGNLPFLFKPTVTLTNISRHRHPLSWRGASQQ
jgi:hypothetical protein